MENFPRFVRIVTNAKTQTVEINGKKETKIIIDRTVLKITEMLSQALKFSYKLSPAIRIETGRPLSNGTWTGMVGALQRNETDMVIGTISTTIQRLAVVDFSYPYYRNKIIFATRKPEYIPDLLAFLLPFSLDTWIFTIATLFLIPAALFLVFGKKHAFKYLLFSAYKTIVLQDMGLEPKRAREYILLTFWQIGAGFLVFCYAGVLLSFLTFPRLSGVRTIPELAAAVAKGKYECTSYPGGFLIPLLLKSEDPRERIIGQSLKQNKGTRDIEAVLGKKKSRKKPVFIGGEIELRPYKLKYFISEDEFAPALRSIGLKKHFCCKRQVDKVIGYALAAGIFEKLKQDHMFLATLRLIKRSSDILKKHEERPLTIEDLAGAFIFLVFGYVLATVVLIVELVIGKSCMKLRKHPYSRIQKRQFI